MTKYGVSTIDEVANLHRKVHAKDDEPGGGVDREPSGGSSIVEPNEGQAVAKHLRNPAKPCPTGGQVN